MGQRANYILIENGKQIIYYNHWRAGAIGHDLYLGEERFIEFVKSCKRYDVMLDEVWIEGCVVVDTDQRSIYFWCLEFTFTSVIDLYVKELQKVWKNWNVNLLYNRMYDIEQILNIDYISKQEIIPRGECSVNQFVDDSYNGEWTLATVVIITAIKTHIKRTSHINIEEILNFGEAAIEILMAKPVFELPKEESDEVYQCIVINTIDKEIKIDKSAFGLWEQAAKKWPGYKFEMGDFGYIGVLNRAGIDTTSISMSPQAAKAGFVYMTKRSDFDPMKFATALSKAEKDIQFNPDFFDNTKPKESVLEKLKSFYNRFIKK